MEDWEKRVQREVWFSMIHTNIKPDVFSFISNLLKEQKKKYRKHYDRAISDIKSYEEIYEETIAKHRKELIKARIEENNRYTYDVTNCIKTTRNAKYRISQLQKQLEDK